MKSRWSRPLVAAFELVFNPWMRRRIHDVLVTGIRPLPAGPLLLVANHVSWWDPFVLRAVQRRIRPRAPMLTLMSTKELDRRPLFRRMGVIGLDDDAASIRSALRVLAELTTEHPDAAIVFFPQGRIWPSHRRPLGFRRGVELFIRHLDPVVVPVGLHQEPLNFGSPTFFASLAEPITGGTTAARLETVVEDELSRILDHLAAYGEDATRLWPAPDNRLPPPEVESPRYR